MSLDIPAEESRQPSTTEYASPLPARRSRDSANRCPPQPDGNATRPQLFPSSTGTGRRVLSTAALPVSQRRERGDGSDKPRFARIAAARIRRFGRLRARSSRVEKMALGYDHGSRDLQVADTLVRHVIRLAGSRTVVGRQPFDNRNSAHGAPEPVFAKGSSKRVGTRRQLPEQRPPKPWVAGSSPVGRTNRSVRPRPTYGPDNIRLTGKS